jgi:hypothetical protein
MLDRPVSNKERIEAQTALFALEKEDYERDNPLEKMTDMRRREHEFWQRGCERYIRERQGPAYVHFDINPFCDRRSQPWNRKIYVNPRLSAVPDFVRRLRREAVAEGLPIFDAKTYRLALAFDSDRSVIGQRHNFFCLYLWEDEALPALLKAIQRVERELEAMGHRTPVLLAQPEGNYLRGAHALGGKAMLGLDLGEGNSFDHWTMAVRFKGQEASKRVLEGNPNASPEEVRETVRNAMVGALRWYRGEDIGPDQYLSFPEQ